MNECRFDSILLTFLRTSDELDQQGAAHARAAHAQQDWFQELCQAAGNPGTPGLHPSSAGPAVGPFASDPLFCICH